MASDLEEPGWPNLHTPGVPSPGETFLNAFMAVSQVNARKSALQDQLAKLNLQMQKQQFDEQFKEADFARKSEYQQMIGLLREKQFENSDELNRAKLDIASQKLDITQKVAGQKFNQIKDQGEDTQAYTDEVDQLRKQFAPGTLQYEAGLQTIRGRHVDALGSTAGRALDRGYQQEHSSARDQLYKNADMAMKTLRMSMATNTKGGAWTLADLQRPPEHYRTEGGNVMIAEAPVKTGPNTMRYEVIPGDEISKFSTKDQQKKWPGLRQRTVPKSQFDQWMELKDTVNKYAAGGELHPSPLMAPLSKTDLARQALDDPDATAEEKAAAKRILGQ